MSDVSNSYTALVVFVNNEKKKITPKIYILNCHQRSMYFHEINIEKYIL